jgi:hypothetical protein
MISQDMTGITDGQTGVEFELEATQRCECVLNHVIAKDLPQKHLHGRKPVHACLHVWFGRQGEPLHQDRREGHDKM